MRNIRNFLSKNFQFLVVKFSIYLNRRVFVMSQFYSRKTSPLILKQLRITNICSVNIGVLYLSCEAHMITNTAMKQSKELNGDLKAEHKKTIGPRWARPQILIVMRQPSETDLGRGRHLF